MFRVAEAVRTLLSGSAGVPEAPALGLDRLVTHGRIDEEWVDVHNIVPVEAPSVRLDFNSEVWRGLTGHYSWHDIIGPEITNAPFEVRALERYDCVVQTIAGEDGSHEQLTVRSTLWVGLQFYIRSAPGQVNIIEAVWKRLDTFNVQPALGATIDTSFTTVLTHPLVDGALEQITFFVYGLQTSGGTGTAFFEVSTTAHNIAGVTSLIGSTIVVAHKSSGVINVETTVDGAENILLRVRGTLAPWSWRIEARFNEVRIV